MTITSKSRTVARVHAAWTIETDDSKREVRVVPAKMRAAYVWLVIWLCVMVAVFWYLNDRELLPQGFLVLSVIMMTLVSAGAAALTWHRQQGGPILTLKLDQYVASFDRLGVTIPFERIKEWRVERDPDCRGDDPTFNLDCIVRSEVNFETERIPVMANTLKNDLETLAQFLTELIQR